MTPAEKQVAEEKVRESIEMDDVYLRYLRPPRRRLSQSDAPGTPTIALPPDPNGPFGAKSNGSSGKRSSGGADRKGVKFATEKIKSPHARGNKRERGERPDDEKEKAANDLTSSGL